MNMKLFSQTRKNILLKIALPALLSFLLFIASIFWILLPTVEKNLLAAKREQLRELTRTAISFCATLQRQVERGALSPEKARSRAAGYLRDFRYGEDNKDYFWVTDMRPVMLVHPYRPDLEGRDLSDYQDRGDVPVFVLFADMVRQRGQGYLHYSWQWKDAPGKEAPKLSYVQGFEPWGWIVGTGVYIEDVREKIAHIRHRILEISLAIALMVGLLLFFITRESLKLEIGRQAYEKELNRARERYRALVEASTEGVMLVVEGEDVFLNKRFQEITGHTAEDLKTMNMADLFAQPLQGGAQDARGAHAFFEGIAQGRALPCQMDVVLQTKDGRQMDAVLGISRIHLEQREGLIVGVKSLGGSRALSDEKRSRIAMERLLMELQTALLFLNQPVRLSAEQIFAYDDTLTAVAAARLMSKHSRSALLIHDAAGAYVGILTDSDIRRRLVAEERSPDIPVSDVMSSPLITIGEDAMVYEAIVKMKESNIKHLLLKGRDGRISHFVSDRDLMRTHQYSLSFLSLEINRAASVQELLDLRERVPDLIVTLVQCGALPENITRITGGIADAILVKLLEFAIRDLGTPPAPFSFLVLGSVGRREQTLKTDQDNAIVFEDVPEALMPVASAYFLKLGQRVCRWLDAMGYSLCQGEVMAMNPRWCVPLSTWKDYFSGWVTEAGPEELLDMKIFFDFRGAYGSEDLVRRLRAHLDALMDGRASFMRHLVKNCLLFKPPIGMFKKIVVEPVGAHREEFSLKKAMTPIVDLARIYALKYKIPAQNTLARLEGLYAAGVFNKEDYHAVSGAYGHLMRQRFLHQAAAIRKNSPPDNYVNPKTLSSTDRLVIRETLAQVAGFQAKLSGDFHAEG